MERPGRAEPVEVDDVVILPVTSCRMAERIVDGSTGCGQARGSGDRTRGRNIRDWVTGAGPTEGDEQVYQEPRDDSLTTLDVQPLEPNNPERGSTLGQPAGGARTRADTETKNDGSK